MVTNTQRLISVCHAIHMAIRGIYVRDQQEKIYKTHAQENAHTKKETHPRHVAHTEQTALNIHFLL